MGHRVSEAAHISHPAAPRTWNGSTSVPCGPLLPPHLGPCSWQAGSHGHLLLQLLQVRLPEYAGAPVLQPVAGEQLRCTQRDLH